MKVLLSYFRNLVLVGSSKHVIYKKKRKRADDLKDIFWIPSSSSRTVIESHWNPNFVGTCSNKFYFSIQLQTLKLMYKLRKILVGYFSSPFRDSNDDFWIHNRRALDKSQLFKNYNLLIIEGTFKRVFDPMKDWYMYIKLIFRNLGLFHNITTWADEH